MTLKRWFHTTGAAPPKGSCGTCVWVRRDEAALKNESRFYCLHPRAYIFRVKVRSLAPPYCPAIEPETRLADER